MLKRKSVKKKKEKKKKVVVPETAESIEAKNERIKTEEKRDRFKIKLEQLDAELQVVLLRLEPLEIRRDKIRGDMKYFEGRVENLTARLLGGG